MSLSNHYNSLKELGEKTSLEIFYTCEKCKRTRYILCYDKVLKQNAIFKYIKFEDGYALADCEPIYEHEVHNIIKMFHKLCHPEHLKSEDI
jgi:hypothetical protein